MLAVPLISCSSSDDEPNMSNNNSKVVINANGTTSTGAIFSPIDGKSFYLDYIEYEIVDAHLEIVGADTRELKGDVRPYATVVYGGTAYNTLSINDNGFNGCPLITSISIPNTVTGISYHSLGNCSNLKTIYIPASVTKIISPGCSPNLEAINVDPKNINYTSVDGVLYTKNFDTLILCPAVKTTIDIPWTVCEIDQDAFGYCKNIKSLILPPLVEKIYPYTFSGCENLTDIWTCCMADIEVSSYGPTFLWNKITLHVPEEMLSWYKETSPWYWFSKIIGDYKPNN